MRKIFFLCALCASVAMFADEISSIAVSFNVPKAGDATLCYTDYNSTNNPINLTVADGANYHFSQYNFYRAGGYYYDETALLENTDYEVTIFINANDGYTFAATTTILANGNIPDEIVTEMDNFRAFTVRFNSGTATALDNTAADTKAVKRLVNGQLLIEKNGRTFNALGAEVK